MNRPITDYEVIKVWYDFQKDMIKSIISQILQSPELTTQTNTLTINQKKQYKKMVDQLADQVISKEAQYYQEKYKINSPEDFSEVIENLSEEEITRIRKKMCDEVIKEM